MNPLHWQVRVRRPGPHRAWHTAVLVDTTHCSLRYHVAPATPADDRDCHAQLEPTQAASGKSDSESGRDRRRDERVIGGGILVQYYRDYHINAWLGHGTTSTNSHVTRADSEYGLEVPPLAFPSPPLPSPLRPLVDHFYCSLATDTQVNARCWLATDLRDDSRHSNLYI